MQSVAIAWLRREHLPVERDRLRQPPLVMERASLCQGVGSGFWLGHGGLILREDIAQGLLERPEPRLVVTPLIHALRVDRAPHLLGADGLDDAGILIEAQTVLLVRQAAILEHAPQRGLRIRNQLLVVNTVHASRQHLIEMPQQLDVVAGIAAELAQIIAEAIPAGEDLLVTRETAAERMPAHIDDRRAWKHQLNEADVRIVGQHLVDESRLVRFAVCRGELEVAVRKRCELAALEICEGRRVARGALGLRARGLRSLGLRALHEILSESRQLGELSSALHLRVSRQHLLEERGSTARQTNDEDGLAALTAPSLPLFKELLRLDGSRMSRTCGHRFGVIEKSRPVQRIATGIVLEGGRVVLFVLKGLSERELEMRALEARGVGSSELVLHGAQIGRRKPERLEIGQTRPGATRTWLYLQRPSISLDGFGLLAGLAQ